VAVVVVRKAQTIHPAALAEALVAVADAVDRCEGAPGDCADPARNPALARAAAPLMTDGGSIIGMSYYGAKKVVPHYNVMGVAKAALEACTRYLAYDLGAKNIRVNCISAGPVQTLAARGISGFGAMIKHYEEHAPLKRSCTTDELGHTGVFLASNGGSGITGQVIYVDGGYEIMGM
jgi:enoyl-[acyl-carrier protein] reductase I